MQGTLLEVTSPLRAVGRSTADSGQADMTLATILGLFALLSWSRPGSAIDARFPVMVQATQSQQEAPPASSPQEPSKPTGQEPKPEQSAAPSQTPAPGAAEQPQNPPPDAGATQKPENAPPDSTTKKPDGNTTSPTGGKTRKHSRKHKPATSPGPGSSKTVVRDGSTADPVIQISPSVTEEQASHERQNTTQLLATTNANLKKMSGRQLSPNQQDMVNQIRKYMEQASAAVDAGDLQRARNLAFKAHLLSDELVKP